MNSDDTVSRRAYERERRARKEAENLLEEKGGELYSAMQALVVQKETTEAKNADLSEANRDLERARSEAALAAKSKSEFLANMSHEIRTPMTAILGFAEKIADNVQRPENIEAVAIIRRNGEHLLQIINEILDFSKIEAGGMAVESVDCELILLIDEVVTLIRPRAEQKNLDFNVEFIGAVPAVIRTDPTRLRQILFNILGNAIKFTEEGAVRLIVRSVPNDDTPHIQFDVLDTGVGMSREQSAGLFRPFSQADGSTTRRFGGTGLGLIISKCLAELLGGDVVIVDTDPDAGTRFRVTIAAGSASGVRMIDAPATMARTETRGDSPAPSVNLEGRRVLLAEDGPDNQRLISFILQKAGADVTVMENGKLALDEALAAREDGRPFDVILMDLQMPVMSGYEASMSLRDAGYTGPIIALTAHAMAGDREKCLRSGCDDYMTKPIDRNKLIGIIAHHVQQAGQAA